MSWRKERQGNWIGHGRDKRRPLNRITPSIIQCAGSNADERVRRRSSVNDTARAKVRYDRDECPLGGRGRWPLVQAFSSFPGQEDNICRRQAILSLVVYTYIAGAYTRNEREREPGAGSSPYNTRLAQPSCNPRAYARTYHTYRMYVTYRPECMYVCMYVRIRVRFTRDPERLTREKERGGGRRVAGGRGRGRRKAGWFVDRSRAVRCKQPRDWNQRCDRDYAL